MAFLALQTDLAQKVHLVFTNAVLMNKDKVDFEALWTLSSLKEKVAYHDDIAFTAEEGELIIFDEADEYIYDDPTAFVGFIKKHLCVCLTATSGGNDQEVAERTVLEHIGLKVFENALFSEQNPEPIRFQ